MRWIWIAVFLAGCGDEKPAGPGSSAPAFPARCPECRLRSGPAHACGVTRWCSWCGRDAGDGHVCDRTGFCPKCHRETGKGHVCEATEICPRPGCQTEERPQEHAPLHFCGRSSFCPTCKEEAGADHSCRDRTYFCPRCGVDATELHDCDRSRYCRSCQRERSVQGPHECGHTRYCPLCGQEVPYRHVHSAPPPAPSSKNLDIAPVSSRLEQRRDSDLARCRAPFTGSF